MPLLWTAAPFDSRINLDGTFRAVITHPFPVCHFLCTAVETVLVYTTVHSSPVRVSLTSTRLRPLSAAYSPTSIIAQGACTVKDLPTVLPSSKWVMLQTESSLICSFKTSTANACLARISSERRCAYRTSAKCLK